MSFFFRGVVWTGRCAGKILAVPVLGLVSALYLQGGVLSVCKCSASELLEIEREIKGG
jgi:hypothetical protein